jgi:hypothetical protein
MVKNIILIVIGLSITFSACKKKDPRLTYIQGMWEMTQLNIDNKDSTQSTDKCYSRFSIEYYLDSKKKNTTLHLYDFNSNDFGATNFETQKFERIDICGYDFINYISPTMPCVHVNNSCVNFAIDNLSQSNLQLSATIKGKNFIIKFKKR